MNGSTEFVCTTTLAKYVAEVWCHLSVGSSCGIPTTFVRSTQKVPKRLHVVPIGEKGSYPEPKPLLQFHTVAVIYAVIALTALPS